MSASGTLLTDVAEGGPEDWEEHHTRFGTRTAGGWPPPDGDAVVDALARAGLRGRGGAGYPTARKWQAVRLAGAGDAVVVANGAETEPLSRKDRLLMRRHPHLVLDGLLLAAEVVGARQAMIGVAGDDGAAAESLEAALGERRRRGVVELPVRLVRTGHHYVAGEETALIAHLDGRPPRPSTVPPRPHQRGVKQRPTLVQNVETLARAALIARDPSSPAAATMLVTVGGAVQRSGVYDVPIGASLAAVVAAAGGASRAMSALLVGGYFGRWVDAAKGWDLRLGVDLPAGAGVIAVLPQERCGVAQTADLIAFLARESARQCGPCEHGLQALSTTTAALAAGRAKPGDLARLTRWTGQIRGRGACRHPDGAIVLLESALDVFSSQVDAHLRSQRCRLDHHPLFPSPHWTGGRR